MLKWKETKLSIRKKNVLTRVIDAWGILKIKNKKYDNSRIISKFTLFLS